MSDDDAPSVHDLSAGSLFDETIDIDRMLEALDRDLEQRLSIARRLEPILRDIVSHYGVPPDNWHSFGVVFRFDTDVNVGGESGVVEIGGMRLRASGTRERSPGAPEVARVDLKGQDP